jgi:hypothetical protein
MHDVKWEPIVTSLGRRSQRHDALWRGMQLALRKPLGERIRLAKPPQLGIELAVDMIALLDRLLIHLLRLGAVEFDLMIGAKGFDDRIETLTRPWKELTKPMDSDPVLVFREALIGPLELLSLGLRF